MKIERVIAELKAEQKLIEKAIAALTPLVGQRRSKTRARTVLQRQKVPATNTIVTPREGKAEKHAKIIQFPPKMRPNNWRQLSK